MSTKTLTELHQMLTQMNLSAMRARQANASNVGANISESISLLQLIEEAIEENLGDRTITISDSAISKSKRKNEWQESQIIAFFKANPPDNLVQRIKSIRLEGKKTKIDLKRAERRKPQKKGLEDDLKELYDIEEETDEEVEKENQETPEIPVENKTLRDIKKREEVEESVRDFEQPSDELDGLDNIDHKFVIDEEAWQLSREEEVEEIEDDEVLERDEDERILEELDVDNDEEEDFEWDEEVGEEEIVDESFDKSKDRFESKLEENVLEDYEPNSLKDRVGMRALTALQRKKMYETTESLVALSEKTLKLRTAPIDKETYQTIVKESKKLLDKNIEKANKDTPGYARYKKITTHGEAENLKVIIPVGKKSEQIENSFDERSQTANIAVTSPPSDITIGLTLELNRKLSPLEMKACGKIEIIIKFYEAAILANMVIRFDKKDEALLKADDRYLTIQAEIKDRGEKGFRKYLKALNTEENPRPLGTPLPKRLEESKDRLEGPKDEDDSIRFTG